MIIDVFSKKLQVFPLKKKTGDEVVRAFHQSFAKEGPPQSIFTDEGLEFTNQKLQKLLKEHFIQHRVARNKEVKAAVVERVNRTIKNKLFKIMTMRGTKKYIDCLQDVVKTYNDTYHRTIGMTPNQVSPSNTPLIFRKLYGADCVMQIKSKKVKTVKPGAQVRVKLDHKPFSRGYTSNWSNHVLHVDSANANDRAQFALRDSDQQKLRKRYYPEEVQHINRDYDEIEKVVKRNGGQMLVKWKNKPNSQNSWIAESVP
ncbi:putative uncharacterized transposon-derived protein F54H12.3 [Halotydeus destructor]|nr:putative uncharacterized transposon-derived protein F54H12.3 [Halotydeus destructor]